MGCLRRGPHDHRVVGAHPGGLADSSRPERRADRRGECASRYDLHQQPPHPSQHRGPFKDQLGKINYVFAPQITLVPFRGKFAIFQKIFVDTDFYIFGGPAFVGLTERAECGTEGTHTCDQSVDGEGAPPAAYTKGTKDRTALTGTVGVGLSFYMGKFMSLGLEYRMLPFAWNTGGFDTRGADPGGRFPDRKIDNKDRAFKLNQLLSVSIGFYFPTLLKSSE